MAKSAWRLLVLAALGAAAVSAHADDRDDYNRRAAARDAGLFRSLDRNGDGRLTREEAAGDLTLGPRFDDADIDRDGIVTQAELQRYLEHRYGVRQAVAAGVPQ